MDDPKLKSRLAMISNASLILALASCILAVLWFVLYTPDGDMGRGMTRFFGSIYLLLFAGVLLVISSLLRGYLLKKESGNKTTRQYILVIVSAIPAGLFLLWFVGFVLIIAYEKYVM